MVQQELFSTDELTSSQEAHLAKMCPWLAKEKGWQKVVEHDPLSPSSLSGLQGNSSQGSSSGRMSQEQSNRTTQKTSSRSSVRLMTAGMVVHGECWTHSTPEWTAFSEQSPNAEGVCGLSDVLEEMSPRLVKYFLSETALLGILRRADARGKALPPLLKNTIAYMIEWWKAHPEMAIALDGDKLKPRTDQRKGGNGFGINEDGAGYTLTGVDRHGVAYKADGVFYDALKNFPVLEGVSHTVCNGTSPGHHVGVVCKRTNDVGDKRAQEVVVHSVNSNGGDVMPTLRACEHKGVDNQKDLGGGYIVHELRDVR